MTTIRSQDTVQQGEDVISQTMVAIDRAEVFKNILALNIQQSDYPTTLCLASIIRKEPVPRFARLEITQRMAKTFRETIGTFLTHYQQDVQEGNLKFPEMGVESRPEANEIETLDATLYQPILDQIDPLTSLSSIELFDNDKKFVAGMRFYVAIVQVDGDDPVYFFRVHTQQKLLSRSLLLAVLDDKGRYDSIKESVMAFDQEFDCIYRSGILYILNKDNFQSIFRFLETIRTTARKTLTDINATIPIHNLEALIQVSEGNVAMLQKLKRISQKSYFKDLTINDIKRVIDTYKLNVRVVNVDGHEQVLFDPNAKGADKYTILRIFNDDYLKSVMTNRNYEVTDKRDMD